MEPIRKIIKTILPRSIYTSLKKAYYYIASLRFVGNKFECPLCGGKFSMLLPEGVDVPVLKEKQVIGGGYRLSSKCPRCFSIERERMLYLYLNKAKQDIFSRNIKLLHVAPEENLGYKLKSCPNIDYLSVDIDSPLVDMQMDITNITHDDDTYDVIICNHVLEHILDDIKAMRELYRVLKKGGFAILQVPLSYSMEKTFEDSAITSCEDRKDIFGQKDHVRIYGKDYTLRLEKAGFTVNEIDCAKEFDPSWELKYGLLKGENIFLCSK